MADPFLMNLDALSKAGNVPLRNAGDMTDYMNNARSVDAMTLADIPAQREAARLKAAADLEAVTSQNKTRNAQLPGVEAEAAGKVRDQSVRKAIPLDDEVKHKLSQYAKEISESDLKQLEAQTEKLLRSSNPEEVTRGEQMWAASAHMREVKAKNEFEQRQNVLAANKAMDVANIYASQRERTAGAKAPGAVGTKERLMADLKGATPEKAVTRIQAELSLLENMEGADPAYKQQVSAMLDSAYHNWNIKMYNEGVKGQWAKGADGQWALIASKEAAAPAGGAKKEAAPAKSYTIDELKSRYPNATEQQIKDAAKAKGITIK